MSTQFNFINSSGDMDGTQLVIYQQDAQADNNGPVTAWHTIRHCGFRWEHPFTYSDDLEVAVSDDYGNYSPRQNLKFGQIFEVEPTVSGRMLTTRIRRKTAAQVKVINRLPRGAINVNIFRSGAILARKTAVAPEQSASFSFEPELWIGTRTAERDDSDITSTFPQGTDKLLSIAGITSANIIMTGGFGAATPLAFELANINSG